MVPFQWVLLLFSVQAYCQETSVVDSTASDLAVDSSTLSASVSASETSLDPSASVATTAVESSSSTEAETCPLATITVTVSLESAPPTESTPPPLPTQPETTTRNIIPVTPLGFEPFPTPSDAPIANVYPETDPSDPPPPYSDAVPNFNAAWASAYEKAKGLIAQMTLEEKVNVTTGVGWQVGPCVGNIPAVKDIFPGLCLEDGPLGIRFADFVTAFPAGINAAATFNRGLIRLRGLYMGREQVGKGVNIALGPMMNMGRVAQAGRNFEGFGADPYLAGEAAYETILGMQQAGIQACAKHIIGNEQEHKRTMSSSELDDRTQHEIYIHPFMRSVMAGVASFMCAYNLINGTYACENDILQNQILKHEVGFQGFIMSDWQSTMSTMSIMTGLDMSMPGDITFNSGDSYFGGNLTAYIQNQTIPESRLDDMATRIIASWYLLKQDSPSYPKLNFNAWDINDEETNEHVDVQANHYKLVRKMGAASIVLLKNVNGTLPLKKPRTMALIGSNTSPGRAGGPNQFPDRGGSDGILAMGWGSGTAEFTYLISPYEAIQARARRDHTTLSWWFDDFDTETAGVYAKDKSAAIVFISADSGEEYITVDGNKGDRKNLTAWHGGDDLVRAAAAQNENTIVVVNSVGPLTLEPWIEHPNVTAVLWAGLGGNEAGNAIVDVLYGAWNPTGRLPYTIAKQPTDYNAPLILGGEPEDIIRIPYTEGLEIDYRYFDAKNVTPRFEFGFGLSYSSFEYSDLKVERVECWDDMYAEEEKAWERSETMPVGQGSSRAIWLHRPYFKVTFCVKNLGPYYGGDIPQLYLHMPADAGEPPSILRGFADTVMDVGEGKTVSMTLSRYDLSIWDTEKQGWKKPEGEMTFSIGTSSRDFRLNGTLA